MRNAAAFLAILIIGWTGPCFAQQGGELPGGSDPATTTISESASTVVPTASDTQLNTEASTREARPVKLLLRVSSKDPALVDTFGSALALSLVSSPYVLSLQFFRLAPSQEEKDSQFEDQSDLQLTIKIAKDGEGVRVNWRISDPAQSTILAEGQLNLGQEDPGESRSTWAPIIEAIRQVLLGRHAERLIIAARPGTWVKVLDSELVIPESGQIELQIEVPVLITWTAKAEGALDEVGSTYIRQGGTRLDIPFRPILRDPKWAVDLSMYSLAFPEARVNWKWLPDLSLRSVLIQYCFGFFFLNSYSGEHVSLIFSTSLVQAGIGIAWEPKFPVLGLNLQPYLAVDFFVRLAFPDGKAVFIDPVAPFGLSPILGFDWAMQKKLGLFFEFGANVYPWSAQGLMLASARDKAGMTLKFGGPGWFTGHPGWFGEFPIVRWGLKLHF